MYVICFPISQRKMIALDLYIAQHKKGQPVHEAPALRGIWGGVGPH
jgi:hypothetical protein